MGYTAGRLFLFTATIVPSVLSAQVRLQCRAENGAAVPFASVTWRQEGEAFTAQTDDHGALTVPADPGRPVVLCVRMMGFTVLEDTLLGGGPHALRLSPSSINMPELVVTGQYGANIAENAVHRDRKSTRLNSSH